MEKFFRIFAEKIDYIGSHLKVDLRYVIRGLSWLSTSQAVTILTSFLLSIAFANLITPEVYGIYRYLITIGGIVAISTLSGLNISFTTSVAQGKDGDWSRVVKTKFLSGLLGTFGGLCLAAYYLLQANNILGFSLIIVSVFAPSIDALLIYNSLLQGKHDFKRISQYGIVSQIIFAACLSLTIFLTDNIYIIIASYFVSLFIGRYISFKLTLEQYPTGNEGTEGAISHGIHLSINSAVTTIAISIDKLIVFTYLGALELAIYSIATTPVDQIRGVFKNLYTLLLPKYAKSEASLIKSDMIRKSIILLVICFFVMLVYIAVAPTIFPLIFPKYNASINLTILSALSFLTVPALLPNTLLQAKGSSGIYYRYSLLTNLGQIILLFVGAYYYQLIGVVVAKVVGQFWMYAVSVFYSKKVT